MSAGPTRGGSGYAAYCEVVSDTHGGSGGLSFRLGSIPVSMPWSSLLGMGLIAYFWLPRFAGTGTSQSETVGLAVAFAALFYVTILGHELAHAWVAKRCGFPVHGITLWAFGGFTSYERRVPSAGREALIAVSGPIASVLIGLAAYGLAGPSEQVDERAHVLLLALGSINVLMGIFNALPGLPLDGGAVLKSAVWGLTGNEVRGITVAAWSGCVVAILVFVALLWPDLSAGRTPDLVSVVVGGMISAFLFSGAWQTLRSSKVTARVPGISARTLARRSVAVGSDVPLSEALRQAQEAHATGLVVVDAAGRPVAVAQQAAVAAVPVERRPWVPVSSVSAALDPRAALSADLSGMDLLQAMQQVPASHYLVVEPGGGLVGVLATADVESALSGSQQR